MSSSSFSSSILCTFIDIFLFCPSRKKEYLQRTTVTSAIMCCGFVVTCFLTGRNKILGSDNILGNRVENFSPKFILENFFILSLLILSLYIVMGSFCLAINCAISWNINPFLKPSLGGEYISNTVFR